MQIDVGMVFQSIQQQSHQRPVVKDPTDGVMGTVVLGKISQAEQGAPVDGLIPQIQLLKRHQVRCKWLPEIQALQQTPTGMGDRVRAAPTLQGAGVLNIGQDNKTALLSKSEGCESTGWTSTNDVDG